MMGRDTPHSRVARWAGLLEIAGTRIRDRATNGLFNRVTLTVAIVALAVALLVVVTGISVGLATESTVYGNDVDYWIVPESSTTLTTVVSVRGPQLGDVHNRSRTLSRTDGIQHSTPVLVDIIRLRTPQSDGPQYVLGVGIVPPSDDEGALGLSDPAFTRGDPYFAEGEYDGEMTGEVVLSPGATTVLNASNGSALAVASPASGEVQYSSFTVTNVSKSAYQPFGGKPPVAVFHLSELQTLTGADEGDQADQILVQTNSPGARSTVKQAYPDDTVIARDGLNTQQVLDSDFPLAVSVTALVVGLLVASLFMATTMGLEVEANRQELAILAAIGISERGRLSVVAVTTLSLALVGGFVGVALGTLGIVVANAVLTTQFALPAVADYHPALLLYGVGVALVMGLLAAPYPLLVARRTEIQTELGR